LKPRLNFVVELGQSAIPSASRYQLAWSAAVMVQNEATVVGYPDGFA
jgi:hypothetical protein